MIDSAAADPAAFGTILEDLLDRTGRATGSGVALAVSGGGDSLALAVLTSRWSRRSGALVMAFVVDHRLREGSTQEAWETVTQLGRLGIEARVLSWPDPRPGHAAARNARYTLLDAAARRHGIHAVLTGHTADDQAETVALRLQRGSGLYGLAGMSAATPLRPGSEVMLLRPLLQRSRRDLAAITRAAGLQAADDPSNHNTEFARVRVRRMLQDPGLGEFAGRRLLQLARACAARRRHVDTEIIALLDDAAEALWWGGVRLNRRHWREAPPWSAKRALAQVLQSVAGRSGRDRSVERHYRVLCGEASGSVTGWGCLQIRDGEAALICREGPRTAGEWRPDRRFSESRTGAGAAMQPLGEQGRRIIPPDHPLRALPAQALPGLTVAASGQGNAMLLPSPHPGVGLSIRPNWLLRPPPFISIDHQDE